MRVRQLSTILLVLSQSVLFAQISAIDSLKIITKSESSDSIRIRAFDLAVKMMAFKQSDSALHYGFTGIDLALANEDTISAASLYLNIGTGYYAKGDYDNALKYWMQSADLSDRTSGKLVKPLALNNVAVIYQNIGRIEEAIVTFQNVILEYERRQDTTRIGRGTFNLGKAYVALGEDSTGLYYIKKSMSVYELLGTKAYVNLANAYNEIGSVYYDDGAYSKALENYQESIRYYEEAGDSLGALKPRGNIANIHLDLKDYVPANEVLRKIIAIRERYKQFNVHFNYQNLAHVLSSQGETDQSIEWYRKALALRQSAGLLGLTTSTAVNLAGVFKEKNQLDSASKYYVMAYEIGQNLDDALYRAESICAYGGWLLFNDRSEEALPVIEVCLAESNEINQTKLRANAAKYLEEIYLSKKDFEKAYKYGALSDQLSDSLFNADLVRELAVKEAEFENEKELLKKENEINLLESKEQVANLKVTLLTFGVILILIIAFLVTRIMIQKRDRKKRELEAITNFRQSMTGMIAHDLKSPLSVILNAHENAVTREMASRMLQLINNMLDVHRFESTEVVLDRKEHAFQSIVDEAKEQVSFLLKEKDLQLESTLTKDFVVIVDRAIIVRVLVNLLTNAIKYSPFNETIAIACQEGDQRLSVSVSDKGSGIPEDQKELIFSSFGQLDPQASGGIGSTGLGLTFVKLALRAHGSPINVHSEPSVGTTFSFQLPLLNVLEKEIIVGVPADHPISFRLKNIVAGKINVLKSLDLHQVGEIERELEEIKGKHEEVDEWVEKVLNSVYAGNKVQYESLIQEVEEIN